MPSKNKIDWGEHLFHCSSLGVLLTNPRSKKDILSQTCTSELNKIWAQHTWSFREIIETDAMRKGNLNEDEAIDMVKRKYYPNKHLVKNQQLYENDFICGTPDIIVPWESKVHDTKCSWNLKTYMASDLEKGYKSQLMGYGWMLGYPNCQLDYCLTSTPEEMILGAIERMAYKLEAIDQHTTEFQKIEHQIRLNMNFDRIPEEQRSKSFKFKVEESFIELIETRAPLWREYLSNIKL